MEGLHPSGHLVARILTHQSAASSPIIRPLVVEMDFALGGEHMMHSMPLRGSPKGEAELGAGRGHSWVLGAIFILQLGW